jgi:hypothetical protein
MKSCIAFEIKCFTTHNIDRCQCNESLLTGGTLPSPPPFKRINRDSRHGYPITTTRKASHSSTENIINCAFDSEVKFSVAQL